MIIYDNYEQLIEGGVSPHSSAQLLVSHAAVFLLLTPQLCHSLRLQELKDAVSAILPLHQALVLLRVDQNVADELPQVCTAWSCQVRGGGRLTLVQCALLSKQSSRD